MTNVRALGSIPNGAEGREMSVPNANVAVLVWETAMAVDENARKLASFLGAEAAILPVSSACTVDAIRQLIPPGAAVVVRAEVLERLAESLGGHSALATLFGRGSQVLVYGFEATPSNALLLRVLSGEALKGVDGLPQFVQGFTVASNHRNDCGAFSGLSVRGVDSARDACFREGTPHQEQSVLIRAGQGVFCVRVECGRADFWLSACSELADIDETFRPEAGLLPWFSRLVPFVMFLRRALGKRLWHSERADACLIIDDPLLKARYGFLDYLEFAASVAQHGFSASIAFIPWNYRRSRKRVAELFCGEQRTFSLCVHGCDHTGGEFATADSGVLRAKARLALERMQAHAKLSGVPFDKVMVFPQGLFSREALEALDVCGYVAAINTGLCPSADPEALKLRDVLDVAVGKFGGFPLFARHYPRELAEFAFDLFLGKPALVVEHHGYFRAGLTELAAFVAQLNKLDARLEWRSPEAICSEACLQRTTASGDIEVRAYTNLFRLTNRGTQAENLVILRQWSEQRSLPAVRLGGRDSVAERDRDHLRIRLSLKPGETTEINLVPERVSEAAPSRWKPGRKYKGKVFVRRMLSEFRDDYVDTNPFLTHLLSRVRKLRYATTTTMGQSRTANVEMSENLQ
jgi:hypothetical protein